MTIERLEAANKLRRAIERLEFQRHQLTCPDSNYLRTDIMGWCKGVGIPEIESLAGKFLEEAAEILTEKTRPLLKALEAL